MECRLSDPSAWTLICVCMRLVLKRGRGMVDGGVYRMEYKMLMGLHLERRVELYLCRSLLRPHNSNCNRNRLRSRNCNRSSQPCSRPRRRNRRFRSLEDQSSYQLAPLHHLNTQSPPPPQPHKRQLSPPPKNRQRNVYEPVTTQRL